MVFLGFRSQTFFHEILDKKADTNFTYFSKSKDRLGNSRKFIRIDQSIF